MKRSVIYLSLILITLAIVSRAAAQSSQDKPRVWEGPLVIPTYELNPPNPYPALLDWQRRKWRPVYPYAFLDSLGTEKKDKTWKAVYLENEYLKVAVLPELGGHVYQIFDKTINRDIIYSNPVMKYAMVALRGAWVSGGIEWNFPDGHTLTTVSPIDYVIRTEADGSAAVAIGDTERVQGMQWQVILRLRAGNARARIRSYAQQPSCGAGTLLVLVHCRRSRRAGFTVQLPDARNVPTCLLARLQISDRKGSRYRAV